MKVFALNLNRKLVCSMNFIYYNKNIYDIFFVDAQKLRLVIDNIKRLHPKSAFSQRTEESSATQYFQFYGYLSQQQNMMQDFVRTSSYQKAILGNLPDFQVNNLDI